MSERTEPWVVVAEYGAVLEADFACATLQEAGIPARVTGAHLGLFGGGYQGWSMYGARVMVPWHREDDARHVLEGLDGDDEHEHLDEPREETP
jgi:hypothetical protein